jgi:FkbM family methyltransferase
MSTGSYAQSGEDEIVLAHFGGRKGFYVDVGAFDGVTNSNTCLLQQLGWRGICVEPAPIPFRDLRDARLSPLTDCIWSACVARPSADGIAFTWLDTIPQFSGVAPDASKVRRECEFRDVAVSPEIIHVPALTLNEILSASTLEIDNIDFVSIDTEGTEMAVLQGFDLNRWKPELLCIETNDARVSSVADYLFEFGYRVLRAMDINTFFVRQSPI